MHGYWRGIAGLLLAAAGAVHAQTHAALVAEMAAASPHHVVKWSDLPESVREVFRQHGILGMSDAGGPFAATDAGGYMFSTDPSSKQMVAHRAPRTRLLLAAQSGSAWLICYEVGGFAHYFNLVEIRPADAGSATASPLWTIFELKRRVYDFATLSAAISENDYWQPPR